MAIYIPYFYIIQDKRNGMYYAGSKYGKDANPDNFMIEGGYPTSSNTIKKLIDQHGLDNFVVCKIRLFETGDEAYDYETKFLQKIDARNHPRFYNGHNNEYILNANDYKLYMLNKFGVDHNMKVPEIQENRKNAIVKKWGSFSNMLEETKAFETAKKTNIKKYGVEYTIDLPHAKERRKEVCMEKYGVENVFKSNDMQSKMRKKGLETFKKNYDERQKPIINQLLNSDIDFTKFGWVKLASEIIGIKPQKVKGWMLRNIPEFYNTVCYKRKPQNKK